MSTLPYVVEFYREGSQECWEMFESPTPFQTFSVGDIIQHALWDGSRNPLTALRVTRVEHVLWNKKDSGRAHHKLMVYAEEFQQTDEGKR